MRKLLLAGHKAAIRLSGNRSTGSGYASCTNTRMDIRMFSDSARRVILRLAAEDACGKLPPSQLTMA